MARLVFFTIAILFFGAHQSGADELSPDLIRQFRDSTDEAAKVLLVPKINLFLADHPSHRAEIAKLYRDELDHAESLSLVSLLASSWWSLADDSRELTGKNKEMVFDWLSDVRYLKGRRYSPPPPRDRAINVLSTCSDSILPDVVELLEHDKPLHRAAGVQVLGARGYFETNIDRLVVLASSDDNVVQSAVAGALSAIKSQRETALQTLVRMSDEVRAQSSYNDVVVAMARQVGFASPAKAWEIQQHLLGHFDPELSQSQLHRAICMVMHSLSAEHQRITVDRIVDHIDRYHWLESAVLAAETNGRVALPHFIRKFEQASEKKKVEEAYHLWRIERDPKRVTLLFVRGLEDKSSLVRYYAFAGITSMGPQADFAVPRLTRLLGHENPTIIRQSLKALAAIKPQSEVTLSAIRSIAQTHPDSRLAEHAAETLQAISAATD